MEIFIDSPPYNLVENYLSHFYQDRSTGLWLKQSDDYRDRKMIGMSYGDKNDLIVLGIFENQEDSLYLIDKKTRTITLKSGFWRNPYYDFQKTHTKMFIKNPNTINEIINDLITNHKFKEK